MISVEEQVKIILKGVQTVVSEEELKRKVQHSVSANKPLIIKLGLDPSAPDIHLGHTVVLRKVRQLQDLGHLAVIVIGDFTGKIGDPTGKSKGRNALSDEQVRRNAETYCEQIFKVIDKNKTVVKFNSEWLAKMSFEDVIRLAANTTVARILERDDFQNRYRQQTPIALHEFFYPLMQAYDSIELHADIELGGTDQTFNILMGRSMQKAYGQEEQVALFMPLLVGLDGVEKMSKSLGNYIGIDEDATVVFKKVMEVPDDLIIQYYNLVTDVHPTAVAAIQSELDSGVNPRDIKYRLAQEITALYNSPEETERAKKFYDIAFSKKSIPENIPQIKVEAESQIRDVLTLLVEGEFIKSKNEFLRMVKQNGIQRNGEKLGIDDMEDVINNDDVFKIGKKKFVKFVISK